jgi:hypothetical protein
MAYTLSKSSFPSRTRFFPDICLATRASRQAALSDVSPRGHVLNLQTITMLRTYFQRIRGVEWIEPKHLQQLADEFVAFVEQYAGAHRFLGIHRKAWTTHGAQ